MDFLCIYLYTCIDANIDTFTCIYTYVFNIDIYLSITCIDLCNHHHNHNCDTFDKVRKLRLCGFEIQVSLSLAQYFLCYSTSASFPINILWAIQAALFIIPFHSMYLSFIPCTFL